MPWQSWLRTNRLIGSFASRRMPHAYEHKSPAASVLKLQRIVECKVEIFSLCPNQERPPPFEATAVEFGERRYGTLGRHASKHSLPLKHKVSMRCRCCEERPPLPPRPNATPDTSWILDRTKMVHCSYLSAKCLNSRRGVLRRELRSGRLVVLDGAG